MIELHRDARSYTAIQRAHKERAEVFAQIFGALNPWGKSQR